MSDKKRAAFTHRIRELINREGLTQEKFAERISVSTSTIAGLTKKTDPRPLSLETAILVRDAFNVSLDWIYGLSKDTNDHASNILADLRKYFRLSGDSGRLSVAIDSRLNEFLLEIEDAEETTIEKNLSDSLKNLWIADIKRRYNERIHGDTPDTPIKYFLFTEGEFKEAVQEGINNRLKQVRPESRPPGRIGG